MWITDKWPPEGKIVLCWLKSKTLPFLGYVKHGFDCDAAKEAPYFVVLRGEAGDEVVAWCDCLPDKAPELSDIDSDLYESSQAAKARCIARAQDNH